MANKSGRGFEFETTKNNSSKWPKWDSEPWTTILRVQCIDHSTMLPSDFSSHTLDLAVSSLIKEFFFSLECCGSRSWSCRRFGVRKLFSFLVGYIDTRTIARFSIEYLLKKKKKMLQGLCHVIWYPF